MCRGNRNFMNILVIGSGGREHSLCWSLRKSPNTKKLFCSPGNAGTNEIAEYVSLNGFEETAQFCLKERIDLVVVGQEAPLVDGITDFLESKGIKVFGPSKAASALEGSKIYMKDLCKEFNIPTAAYGAFRDINKAAEFINTMEPPIVVKADGLAAGKGVIIAESKNEAIKTVEEMFSGKFGDAGKSIVIEEFLEGEEVSFFALSDGENAIPFCSAQDHKKVGDGDTGPNTGGMGTYSPAPIMTEELENRVMKEIINPTLTAMKKRGTPFKGVLFAGLMITKNSPKLLEYNIRFGDPETQSMMLRLKSDLPTLLLASASGSIKDHEVKLYPHAAICVVMAANGYPGDYKKNTEIRNLEKISSFPKVVIFHAGTKLKNGKLLANGGRVLGICATGETIKEARDTAYNAIGKIDWPDGFYRHDIALKAVK